MWPEKSEPWHWLGLRRILYTSYLLFSSPPSTFAASGCAYKHHPCVHYNEPHTQRLLFTCSPLYHYGDSSCIVSWDYCHMLLVSLNQDANRSTVLCCCLALLLLASLQFLHNSILMVPTLSHVWFQILCHCNCFWCILWNKRWLQYFLLSSTTTNTPVNKDFDSCNSNYFIPNFDNFSEVIVWRIGSPTT